MICSSDAPLLHPGAQDPHQLTAIWLTEMTTFTTDTGQGCTQLRWILRGTGACPPAAPPGPTKTPGTPSNNGTQPDRQLTRRLEGADQTRGDARYAGAFFSSRTPGLVPGEMLREPAYQAVSVSRSARCPFGWGCLVGDSSGSLADGSLGSLVEHANHSTADPLGMNEGRTRRGQSPPDKGNRPARRADGGCRSYTHVSRYEVAIDAILHPPSTSVAFGRAAQGSTSRMADFGGACHRNTGTQLVMLDRFAARRAPPSARGSA